MDLVVEEWARPTRGLITRAQLLESVTSARVEWMCGRGDLQFVRSGVYRLPGVAMTDELKLLAAILASGDGAFASHRSAVWLWGLRLPTLEGYEISVPSERRVRVDDIVCRRSTSPSIWLATRNSIPVSSVERTLLDASCFATSYHLEKAMEDAMVRKLTNLDLLSHAFKDLTKQGRRKFAFWREILGRRMDLSRVSESHLQVRIKHVLSQANLEPPNEEYWVRTQTKDRYLDLAFPDLRIGIECDGREAHQSIRFVDDRRRDREFALLGWMILRFTASTPDFEIVNDVAEAIRLRKLSA